MVVADTLATTSWAATDTYLVAAAYQATSWVAASWVAAFLVASSTAGVDTCLVVAASADHSLAEVVIRILEAASFLPFCLP